MQATRGIGHDPPRGAPELTAVESGPDLPDSARLSASFVAHEHSFLW
ncbi:MAG: hypothetical protein GX885_01815 [Methanomicrobiales archaeon]|nr:hypothetical protein [Methanomicrobiales archaeon]